MKHLFALMPLCVSLVLSGCAWPVNRYTAQRYFDAARVAEQRDDYQLAHQNYYRAYVNAKLGHTNDQAQALVMYNLARMKGYLCMKTEAEQLFIYSTEVEEQALNVNGEWYTGRLTETARFYFGFGEYAKAVPYFEKATLRLIDSGVEQSDPIAMADVWDDYAEALRRTGSASKADEVAKRAQSLRDNNENKTARFVVPFVYGTNCKTTD